MSSVFDFAPPIPGPRIGTGCVVAAIEGGNVSVKLEGVTELVECQVLQTGATALTLSAGDAVLVWLHDDEDARGVLLGRLGPYVPPPQPVVAPEAFAARPESLVLEAKGDIILRNGQAKIRLGADGDVEIVCASYTTRSNRLLRLLAPIIKLN